MQLTVKESFTMSHMIQFLGSAAIGAVAACTPAPPVDAPPHSPTLEGGVQVVTDRPSYRTGDPLTLTVYNGSADRIAFNPCTRSLEREQAGGWLAVAEPQRICTMEAWILGPGERRAGPTELPADLAPGRYRAVLAFTLESADPSAGRRKARTAPFAVAR
jgi:hypothetical protein